MSLYPGAPRKVDGNYVLDDQALQDSMAKAIDEAMADVYLKLKGKALPEEGKEDRRLLFVAIARGVLKYFESHESELLSHLTVTHKIGPSIGHNVSGLDLNIQMDK